MNQGLTTPSGYASHTILVHGLGRTRYDMLLLARRLRRQMPNSEVHLFGYPSRRASIREAAQELNVFLAKASGGAPTSFVGHSLGGIIVRALDLHEVPAAPLRRLVTLGTPHNGAAIASFLSRYRPMRGLFGPVLSELGDLKLVGPPRQVEIGCIIGGRKSRWGYLPLLGEDNDGLVTASEALHPQSSDYVLRPLFHGLLPFYGETARLAAAFLMNGSFR